MNDNNNNNGSDRDAIALREDIARTRADMSDTLDKLHGKLNPTVLKEQALEQFHDAKETIKAELLDAKAGLKSELLEVKDHLKAELKAHLADAKEGIRAELIEVKHGIKAEIVAELDTVKHILIEDFHDAKHALREATIGKVQKMMHRTQDTVRDTGLTVVETITQNPIPAAIAFGGLAWLFMSARSKRREMRRPHDTALFSGIDMEAGGYGEDVRRHEMPGRARTAIRDLGSKVADVASTAKDKAGSAVSAVGDLAHTAGDKISSATHVATESVSQFAHDATAQVGQFAQQGKQTAIDLARRAQVRARELNARGVDAYHSNPLIFGAAILAVGTAIGFAIPRTSRESEWMGETRDDLVGKAHDLAHDAFHKVEGAAKDAIHKVEGAAKQMTSDVLDVKDTDKTPNNAYTQKSGFSGNLGQMKTDPGVKPQGQNRPLYGTAGSSTPTTNPGTVMPKPPTTTHNK